MPPPDEAQLHPLIESVVAAALQAADPKRLLKESLQAEGGSLVAGAQQLALHDRGRLLMIAIGKAAPGLAEAAVELLGDRLSAGLAVVPAGVPVDLPSSVQVIEGSHPLPGEGSLAAGRAAADLLADSQPEDRVLALISGGGSAMFELLPPEVELSELKGLTEGLLRSGAPIDEINQVRKALSRVKGGGLARLAAPAPVLALILSDVVGDSLDAVASGPTALQPPNPAAARGILEKYELWDELSPGLQRAILDRRVAEPPIYRPTNILLGSNRLVLSAVQDVLRERQFDPEVMSSSMEGEARRFAQELVEELLEKGPGTALLAGGEATVTVTGSGQGGRNTEMALAAAIALEGQEGYAFLSLATDGRDGRTDAAGAIVTGRTAEQIRQAGLDPLERLADNDSYRALAAADALLHTGPTGTNLNDLALGLVLEPSRSSPS